jgi:hypothetical protein
MSTTKLPDKIAAEVKKASDARLWGTLAIEFKDGVPYLIKTTTQTKIEDAPYVNTNRK